MSSPGGRPDPLPPAGYGYRRSGRGSAFWGGLILVLVGLYFLLSNLGLIRWLSFDIVWPVVLIAIGLYLVIRRLR